jgi:undecaprenyl-diphosphatase
MRPETSFDGRAWSGSAIRPNDDAVTLPGHLDSWRVVCLVTLVAFFCLGVSAWAVGILPGDLYVRHGLLVEDNSALRVVASWVNLAGTWKVLLPLSLAIAALSRAARRHWWLWVIVFLGSAAVEQGAKFLVDRPRPSGTSLGFPSGHTTAAVVFAVITVYLLSRARMHPAARLALQALAIAMALSVGWARILLRAHWPTDVLGGVLLGIACAAGAAWWIATRETRSRATPEA